MPRHLAVLAVCLLAACAAPSPSSGGAVGETRAENQSLVVAQLALPPTLSPESTSTAYALFSAMFDAPVKLDKSSDAQPWAAEKWELIQPSTWRFTLRRGMTFSNGDPLTAADVDFTVKLAVNTRMTIATQFGTLAETKVVDTLVVDFVMKSPDATILPALAGLWIMPKDYYTKVGKDGYAAKPVGSGPFEAVEYRNSDLVRFRKRAAAHPFRTPQLDELVIRAIPEASAMASGIRTGDLDILTGQINADLVEALKRDGLTVELRYSGITFGVFSQPENLQRSTPLTNKQVRLALNYAIDREALAKTIFRGYARPVGQFSIPDSVSYNPTIQPFPYDPALAKRLLSEAGYPNGFKLAVGIEYTPSTVNTQLVTAMQSYFKDVGVEVPVNALELAIFLDKFQGRNGQTKGDIFMQTASGTSPYGSNQRSTHACDRPLVWWCIPEYDRLMNSIIAEADQTKRSAAMREAMRLQREDAAHVDLFAMPDFVILKPNLRGFAWEAPAALNFEAVYRVR